MTRTDHDSWEITESVGATALGVAAARAAETDSEHPLFRDPFARMFLNAAGTGIWSLFDSSALPGELTDADPDLAVRMHALDDLFACRTAFIDEFFRDAADVGVRQFVILAAGLDSRAWRLPWPAGTRVYELGPAHGTRVQILDTARARRTADIRAGRGSYRPARGLAERAAPGGIRYANTYCVVGRGAVALSTGTGTGSAP